MPGTSNRVDSLSIIPNAPEEEKSDKKSKDKKDGSEGGPRKTSWGWFGGDKEKDKKKDDKEKDGSKKVKNKLSKPQEKGHDDTRLDLLQTSIQGGGRGRESVVLDRESVKLEEERKKESARKTSSEGKKEKEPGLLSSIFGGGKKKGEKESSHKKNASRGLSPEPPARILKPDIDYNWTRFSILEERAIYRMAHIKLANPRRELYSQVLLSNFMYSYLAKVQQMHPQISIGNSKQAKQAQQAQQAQQAAQQKKEQQAQQAAQQSQQAPQQQPPQSQPEEFAQYQRYQQVRSVFVILMALTNNHSSSNSSSTSNQRRAANGLVYINSKRMASLNNPSKMVSINEADRKATRTTKTRGTHIIRTIVQMAVAVAVAAADIVSQIHRTIWASRARVATITTRTQTKLLGLMTTCGSIGSITEATGGCIIYLPERATWLSSPLSFKLYAFSSLFSYISSKLPPCNYTRCVIYCVISCVAVCVGRLCCVSGHANRWEREGKSGMR